MIYGIRFPVLVGAGVIVVALVLLFGKAYRHSREGGDPS